MNVFVINNDNDLFNFAHYTYVKKQTTLINNDYLVPIIRRNRKIILLYAHTRVDEQKNTNSAITTSSSCVYSSRPDSLEIKDLDPVAIRILNESYILHLSCKVYIK